MRNERSVLFVALGAGILGLVGGFIYFSTVCSPIGIQENQPGSQGFRVWTGPALTSFEHTGGRVCIPSGWIPLGDASHGTDWAKYENGKTGVVIHPEDFGKETLAFEHSAYEVTLWYPKTAPRIDVELYAAAVRNAFEQTGLLFGDSKDNKKIPHAVLVTSGMPGLPEGVYVYPDPRANLTIYTRSADDIRGEELLTHAVMHVYNRERPDLDAYENNQAPLSAEDFQEMEAAWSETAFRISGPARAERLQYLYSVHEAVFARDFSKIKFEPFNNRAAWDAMQKPSVAMPKNASYLDIQYGHYVLAPLVMVGIEGLLQEYEKGTDMKQVLYAIHKDPSKNLLEELGKMLPSDEVTHVRAWMSGDELIPKKLIDRGGAYYGR
jgi:hypothetical protein